MVIFSISPDYLHALQEESSKYSFSLQGYGEAEEAILGLRKTNLAEILGFVFLARTLPKNVQSLVDFIKLANATCKETERTFLLVATDAKNIATLLKPEDYCNLRLLCIQEFTHVTDILINREIFGAILLANFEPYKLTDATAESLGFTSGTPKLHYAPLLSENVCGFFKPITVPDYETARKTDELYMQLQQSDPVLAMLRLLQLQMHFECVDPDLVGTAGELIQKTPDTQDFCCKHALFFMILYKEVVSLANH